MDNLGAVIVAICTQDANSHVQLLTGNRAGKTKEVLGKHSLSTFLPQNKSRVNGLLPSNDDGLLCQ